jgi:hypothetical protein
VGLGLISLGLLTSRGQNTPRRPLGLLSESSRMALRFTHYRSAVVAGAYFHFQYLPIMR